MKTRPAEDAKSNVLDGISVRTPGRAAEPDSVSVAKVSTAGVKDFSKIAVGAQGGAGGMSQFITNMMKNDKPQYERLVELMRFYNMIDVDLRLISQLKACFISKEQGALATIPIATIKETMRSVFRHFR